MATCIYQFIANNQSSFHLRLKKNLVKHQNFSRYYDQCCIFAAVDLKGHFRKILTRIFKFDYFTWYHAYILEESELDFLMLNLMLNRLAPISNLKNENGKSSYALFQLPFFILRWIALNKGLFLFSGAVWKFLRI